MAQIKTILCLGNQTSNSDMQSRSWAENFGLAYQGLIRQVDTIQPGVYVPDLAQLSMDHVWALTDLVDLIIMLDQPVESFDFVETYQHFIGLCRYKKHFMPVLIANTDSPTIWLDEISDNSLVLPNIVERNIQDLNLVIKLNTVDNVDLFKKQLNELAAELKNRRCRWVYYRAGQHEKLHYEATQVLLDYPEFVFLNPAVFCGPVVSNIRQRIYHHWVNLYLKNNYE
jgi:hypothetical protein